MGQYDSISAAAAGRIFRRVTVTAIAAFMLGAAFPRPILAATESFTLTVQDKPVTIGAGLTYNASTFSGTVPGPLLKARQGDQVHINLVNHTTDAHGIDVHAAQIAPKHFVGDPMKPVDYSFRAELPGVFAYHCAAIPILDHIASGMYGMMVVEPKDGWPDGKAQEVAIVQSEFYGLPDAHGFINGDHSKMLAAQPDFVVFNGAINGYDLDHPIGIKVGKLVRVFFVNAGPNLSSSFNVAGVLFSTVYAGGNPANALHGLSSFEVGPSSGAVFEFRVSEPGDYQFTDLDRANQYKGAMGIFRATR